ncbi:amino acid adenylation domain-containing protein [Streptomyces ziwulingensis]|uniref:Amino acid adenylation domain-containing protein n=1 Tax=Streptomyces ziwulingensis TaxID=1045501 RepID=A0ABP9CVY0_9ACTN
MLPGRTLHEIFASRARATPRRTALSTPDGAVSYGELDARSDLLAARLRAQGVGPNVLVGLCARRGTEAIVAMLGILKARGAYVPIDPGYPTERIDFLLADCGAPILVAATDTAEVMTGRHPAIVWTGPHGDGRTEIAAAAAPPDAGGPAAQPGENHLAYVIYTSGSTGEPKGVAVEHRNAVSLFEQTAPLFGIDHRDTWALFHSISFDFSVWEIWGALLFGGRLVLLPEAATRWPSLLASWLRTQQVTVLNQTPSAFHQFLGALFPRGSGTEEKIGPSLRLVVFGGERLDPRLLKPWIETYGDDKPRLVNMYGITETTVHCTWRRITAADLDSDGDSPIGVPLPAVRVHLLDGARQAVPDGVPGEMYIAGSGVARGYLGRPDLTAERFVAAPPGLGEERLYRSGDRAVRLLGGALVYLGRADAQLKVRGYRIEPGEIEEVLSRMPGITGAVVTARDFGKGDVRLVAHLLPAPAAGVDEKSAADLIAAAEQRARAALPRHLRPSSYEIIHEMPMTLQGKVNRDALGA